MLKIIFSYQRPQLLGNLLQELDGDIIVIDDGSDYDYSEHEEYCDYYYRVTHRGKPYFWMSWNLAFMLCQASDHDHFLFLPDDWFQFNTKRIKWIQNQFREYPYAFNIANHGVARQWTPIKQWQTTIGDFECFRVGFVDCCFSTNRESLNRLDWKMEPISQERFQNTKMSSGVGKQLSKRFLKAGVPMLKPVKSLCKKHHVESQMNKLERKINPRPLI